jgi:hypothetical protein
MSMQRYGGVHYQGILWLVKLDREVLDRDTRTILNEDIVPWLYEGQQVLPILVRILDRLESQMN